MSLKIKGMTYILNLVFCLYFRLGTSYFTTILTSVKTTRIACKAIVFAWQKHCVPEGKKYSLLTTEPKYRQNILSGAELFALHF